MAKRILIVIFFLTRSFGFSQVGIGTDNPSVSLEIVGNPTVVTEADGLLIPKITRSDLTNKTSYGNSQAGTILYVTAINGMSNATTQNILEIGFYYFDGTTWQKIAKETKPEIGDVKNSLKNSDHNGWVKLDGRLINTLTTSQQTQASSLGLTLNLPDATNSYQTQNGTVLGSVSGSNTRQITQNQLPDITLSGTTDTRGDHNHDSYSRTPQNSSSNAIGSTVTGSLFGYENVATSNNGNHYHNITTSSLNGGTVQQGLSIIPKSLSIITFIYLGN